MTDNYKSLVEAFDELLKEKGEILLNKYDITALKSKIENAENEA